MPVAVIFIKLIELRESAVGSLVYYEEMIFGQEGFRLGTAVAYPVGAAVAAGLFVLYLVLLNRKLRKSKVLDK